MSLISVNDAAFAIWAVDENDAATVLLAGGERSSAETMRLWGEFTGRPLQFQGRRFSGEHHEDESHHVEIFNPLLLTPSRTQVAVNLPPLARNRRCGLVVRWFDEEDRVWMKRSYFGVTCQPARLEGDGSAGPKSVMHATLTLRAERMEEASARGAVPGLALALAGEILWRSGTETLRLYAYEGGQLEESDALLTATRARIDFDTPGEMSVWFEGTRALRVTAARVSAKSFQATGGTFGTGDRIEFWMGGVRRATLTAAGRFIAAGFTQADPGDENAMLFQNPGQLLAIGAQVFGPAFADDLP